MNILSLFDGMSCGQIALKRLGISHIKYFSSEIDPFAIKITNNNFPKTIQMGDVTQVNGHLLPKIHILMGGSPCQGLSIANARDRKNLGDERSKLFFEFIRLKKEINPRYFLLENVVMDKQSEDIFSDLMGVPPVLIDSAYFSAQSRKRLYWTNIPILPFKDKGLVFKDVADYTCKDSLSQIHLSRFRHLYPDNGLKSTIGTTALGGCFGQKCRVYGLNNKIPTLLATDYKQPKQVLINGLLRKLTPLEYERLQTVPDNYTQGVSNSQRYKMLGNGWTVDVIAHILSGIDEFFLKP